MRGSKYPFCVTKHPLYITWKRMHQRCTDPKNTGWKYYGGKGVRVCKRWDSFELFVADMGPRPPGMTLDRKNNNGNYCKSNCRWATPRQQAANSHKNVALSFSGERHPLNEWARKFNVHHSSLKYRINKYGWPKTARYYTQPRGISP